MEYIPLVLAGLLAIASFVAYGKVKSTAFLFIMLGFVIQFLIMIFPLIGIYVTFMGYLVWVAYALIILGLFMVKKD